MNQHKKRLLPRDRLSAAIIIATIVFYGIMLWYPIADEFAMSLHSGLILKRRWVGLANFRRLADDRYFWKAISVTLTYAAMVVPVSVGLALPLAAALNSIGSVSARTVFASLFFFPNMVPIAAASTFWKFLLAPTGSGAINSVLGLAGIAPLKWLESTQTALLSLAIVAIWGTVGYVMVLLLAGMQSIPRMLYEAAAIDGANAWHRFRSVTVPLLMPTLTFVVVSMTLGSLMMFGPVYIMTGGRISTEPKGGPAGSTATMVYLIYEQGFNNFKQGYAAAMGVFWFVVMLGLGLTQFYAMSRKRFEY